MHIRVPEAVTANNASSILPEFRQMPPAYRSQLIDLSSASYESNTWIPYAQARASFSASLGGSAGYDAWIRSILKIDPNEAYTKFNSHRKVRHWQAHVHARSRG